MLLMMVLRGLLSLGLDLERRFEKLKALGSVIQCRQKQRNHERWFKRWMFQQQERMFHFKRLLMIRALWSGTQCKVLKM